MLIAMAAAAVIIIAGGVIMFLITTERDNYDRLEEIKEPFTPQKNIYVRVKRITQAEVEKVAEAWKYTEKTPGEPVYAAPPPEPSIYDVQLEEQYGKFFRDFVNLVFDFITAGIAAIGVICIVAGIKSHNPGSIFSGMSYLALVFCLRLDRILIPLYRYGLMPDIDEYPELPLNIYNALYLAWFVFTLISIIL